VASKVLLGAGAWLLGAASATTGSLYAIAQMGSGLVAQHTTQVSVRMVNAELARDAATARSTSPVPTSSPKASHSPAPQRSGRTHPATSQVKYSPKWLWSDGGSVRAICSADGAQLLSESPAQGFEIDLNRIVPGPTAVASVTFTNSSVVVTMKVTCDSAGVPSPNVSEVERSDWHDNNYN
jgi:hypothetical protein